jgi:hypothetical protein
MQQKHARALQWLQERYNDVPLNNLVVGNSYFVFHLDTNILPRKDTVIYDGIRNGFIVFKTQQGRDAITASPARRHLFFPAPLNALVPDQIFMGGKRKSRKQKRRRTTRRRC